jgi:hypothetical protein
MTSGTRMDPRRQTGSHANRVPHEEIDIADVEAGLNSSVSAPARPRRAFLPEDPGEFPIGGISQLPLAAPYPEFWRPFQDTRNNPISDESYDDPPSRFPHDIYSSPSNSREQRQRRHETGTRAVNINDIHKWSTKDMTERDTNDDQAGSWAHRFRGLVHTATHPDDHGQADPEKVVRRMPSEYSELSFTSTRRGIPRADSNYSCTTTGSEVYDPDDPKVTGVRTKHHIDSNEFDKEAMRSMDYRARQKLRSRVKIEFNISCTCLESQFLTHVYLLNTYDTPQQRWSIARDFY